MGHQKASDDVITVINVNSRLLTSIHSREKPYHTDSANLG